MVGHNALLVEVAAGAGAGVKAFSGLLVTGGALGTISVLGTSSHNLGSRIGRVVVAVP